MMSDFDTRFAEYTAFFSVAYHVTARGSAVLRVVRIDSAEALHAIDDKHARIWGRGLISGHNTV